MYHVAEDFSEAFNLADQNPDKLHELQLLLYAEAAKYSVLSRGGLSGGNALLFKEGKPVFRYNMVNVAHYNIAA